ncbi:MAG: hypothetical protein ACJ77A_09495 [Actinomycetota bacterium]
MRHPSIVAAGTVALAFGVLGVAGVATAGPTAPPLPGGAPTAAPPGVGPAPAPTLPVPAPSGSGQPSSQPSGLPTGPAVQCPKTSGSSVQFCFTYGNDRTAWYWVDQQYQNVNLGPVNQQLTLPNPEANDTLPVAIRQGEMNRVSAMYFDLIGHGVPLGAPVTKFVLKIQEETTPTGPEQPEFNAAGQAVAACAATGIWAAVEADVWTDKPAWSQSGCVTGQPSDASPPVWTFELTQIAAKWASDPFVSNQGIVLVPQASTDPQRGNFQVNFKIPSRDDTTTPNINEYDTTKDRVVVDLTYGKPRPTSPPRIPVNPPPPVFGGGGGSGGIGTGGSSACCASGVGSTGTGGSGAGITGGSNLGGSTGTGKSATTPVTQTEPPPLPTVRFPWYVWILLPVGLLALAAVRSILFERAHGVRPGGVIDSIRARNAAARGDRAVASGGAHGALNRLRRLARDAAAARRS